MVTPEPGSGAHSRNLARLCLLRSLLIAALLLVAVLVAWLQDIPLYRDGWLLLAVLLLTGFNLWTLRRLRRRGTASEVELLSQLVVDVLLVTLVLYRTGGSTNPFVSYYLVPLTIAASTLRPRFTFGLALLTLLAYTLLLYFYVPFALFEGEHAQQALALIAEDPHAHHAIRIEPVGGFNLHIWGMWVNFLLSAGLITFFVTRMSRALREQDRRLAEQHERLLRREQVLALGALAAGAAHELGTPLATMSVIARELETALPADSPLREEAALLNQQLLHCRGILQNLRVQAAGESPRLPLSTLLREAVARIELLYPQRRFLLSSHLSERSVQPPLTLAQVLINLLDNAAQAASHAVEVHLREEGGDCVLDIHDDGSGIAPEIAARLGQPFVSGRQDGLGIGYFLSHASVNEWGGSIHLQAGEGGGLQVRLRLPWSVLRPEAEQ